MSDKTHREVETLLSYLHSFGVVELVRQRYEVAHGNDAPVQLLEQQIVKVRQLLSGEGVRCEHEWVDARNKVVLSGEVCVRCGAIRP